MRVTWLCVSERLVHLTDGSHHALNVYLEPIPWRAPAVHLPLAVAFLIEGEWGGAAAVSVRLLTPRGTVGAVLLGQLAGPRDAAANAWPGFMEGFVKIDAPGEYEVQALVDGQPTDDAPTWRLRVL